MSLTTQQVMDVTGVTYRNVHRWAKAGIIPGQPAEWGSGPTRWWSFDQCLTIAALCDYHTACDATIDELGHVARIISKPSLIRRGGVHYFYRKGSEPVLVEQRIPFLPRPGEALVAVRNELPEEAYRCTTGPT